MKRLGPAATAAALALPAAGCGADGVELAGTYQVIDHRIDSTGCTALAVTADPPYIRFTAGDLLGRTYYSVAACPTADAAACTGVLGLSYLDPIDGGWRAELGAAQTAGGCVLDYARSDAILDAATGTVVIDTFGYRDESDRPDAECTSELAVDLGDAMPCVSAEHLEATRI